jgi:hypothetical protein
MSSSPSSSEYALDAMYNDQQSSLSMLDIKDPFYEPFFGSLAVPTDGSSTGFDSTEFANTQDVLQQLFPNGPNNLLDPQQMNSLLMKPAAYQKKAKKLGKKQGKKPKKMSTPTNFDFTTSMNFDAMVPLPTNSSVWIDSSIYPLWPNYICLYLEYSLPYDPSVKLKMLTKAKN